MNRRLDGAGIRRGLRGPAPSSGEEWSPLSDAGLLHWFRADLGVTTGTGSRVTTWEDQVAGYQVTQADGVGPLVTTRNGQDAIEGIGSGSEFLDGGAISPAVAQPYTAIMVGQILSVAGSNQYLYSYNASGGRSGFFWSSSTGGTVQLYAGAILSQTLTGAPYPPSVHAARFDSTSSEMYDEDFSAPFKSGNAGTGGLGSLSVLEAGFGSSPCEGYLNELIITTTTIAALAASFSAYASARYGLTVTT